jgi:aquaglyceroporin related protein
MPSAACFFSEFLGAAVLLLVVMATVDKQNAAPPGNLFPLVIFLVILGIGAALGMETGNTCLHSAEALY